MSDDLNVRSKIWILAVASSLLLLLFFSLVLGGERALLPERAQIRSPLLSISWIQITLLYYPHLLRTVYLRTVPSYGFEIQFLKFSFIAHNGGRSVRNCWFIPTHEGIVTKWIMIG